MNRADFDDVSRKLASAGSRRAMLGIAARAGITALAARFIPDRTNGNVPSTTSIDLHGGGVRLDVVPIAPQPTACADDDLPASLVEEPGTSVIEPTPCLKTELADTALSDESLSLIDAFLSDTHALSRSDEPFSLHIYQEGVLASTVTLLGFIPKDPNDTENPFAALTLRSVDREQRVETYCAILDRGELSRILVVVDGDVIDEPEQPMAIRMSFSQIASRIHTDVAPKLLQSSRKDCSLCVGTCQVAMLIGFAAKSIIDEGLKLFALHLGIKEYASIRCAEIAVLPCFLGDISTYRECYERQKELCDEITEWVLSADEAISKASCQLICEDPAVRGCTTVCIETLCPEVQYYDMDECRCRCPMTVDRPVFCQGQCVSSVCPDGEVFDYFSCSCGCGKGQTICDGQCTDIQTESTHCGGCDQLCDGVCSRGECLESGSCSEGLVDCNGECVDVLQDTRHCGGCGISCGDGQCVDGQCAGGSGVCDDGDSLCNGACVDLSSDVYHCGGCGQVCDDSCLDGRCEAALVCEQGLILCDGACSDLTSDVFNCGACGNQCAEPEAELNVCEDGECYVLGCGETTLCGVECYDTLWDSYNCGGCGIVCDGDCVEGTCVDAGCSDGSIDCGGTCVDTNWDTYNCGGCGNYCDGECEYGACISAGCSEGLTDCGGACTDLNWDPNNCGGCGSYCDGECSYGECIQAGCATGLTDCYGACIDLAWDNYNCGGCGVVCAAGPDYHEECSSGMCIEFVEIGG